MVKKPSEPQKSPAELALQKHVDEMMRLEKDKQADSDVAKLAEDFNKQVLSASSAPELPKKLKIIDNNETGGDEIEVTKDEPKEPELPPEPAIATQPQLADEEAKDPLLSLDDPYSPQPDSDVATDEAVDDIVAKEGDTVLAVEDAKKRKASAAAPKRGLKAKLRAFFKNKWAWVGLAVILIIIFAVPFTRYKVLGLVVKKQVTVTVLDSKTSAPVSNARVGLGHSSAKTDERGQAHLKPGLGSRKLAVSKKYYTAYKGNYFVGFSGQAETDVKFVATGRLVPITVVNKITGKPLVGAQVAVKGTTAKANSKGRADVALPAKAETYKGTIKLSGYNDAVINITVTDKTVKTNTFGLVPKGQVYFLSNLNGTLDVVKSNLDGSGRKVILEGTGNEQASATSLLASRDWRYLVLKARRDTPQAALYLIDTSNDKVTPFDNTAGDFSLVGWYGHSFIYSLTKSSLQAWQPGRQLIKAYDADHQQPNLLDQNQAEGTADGYGSQSFGNFYILNGVVSYTTGWYGYDAVTTGKNNTIRAVQPNGQSKKDYQTFPSSTSFSRAALYGPQGVYYEVYDGGKPAYYEFENQTVKTASIDSASFDKDYPTYLLSPSGNKTFWTELRDGKNALFTGSATAEGKKQIASLSEYAPYGWYSDSYVLVSKNSSELYIMSPTAPTEQPLKITDYYKPAQTYQGYGYGYGGL